MWRKTFSDLWKFRFRLRRIKRKLFWQPEHNRVDSRFRWEGGDSGGRSCTAEVAGFTRVAGDAVGTTEMDSRQPDKEMHRRHLVTLTNAVLQGWGTALWRAAGGRPALQSGEACKTGRCEGVGVRQPRSRREGEVATSVSVATQNIFAVIIPG